MGLKIERLGGAHSMNNVIEICSHCSAESKKCRRRDFSEQAWSVLLVWGEIESTTVDQPLCDACYDELREVLIDRADEMEAHQSNVRPAAVKQPAPAVAATKHASKKAAARGKVRKAG